MTSNAGSTTKSSSSSSSCRSLFTPSWRRSRRANDVVVVESSVANNGDDDEQASENASLLVVSKKKKNTIIKSPPSQLWWQKYPCLVCGKEEAVPTNNSCDSSSTTINSRETTHDTTTEDTLSFSKPSSLEASHNKRCSRCRSAVYCSTECQRQDYTQGKHKTNCLALEKLWKDKSELENSLWYGNDNKNNNNGVCSTNPFDDDSEEERQVETIICSKENNSFYATVGDFWHDHPQSTMQKTTTMYCVTLLQLVQLLGRGESWRVSRIHQQCQSSSNVDVESKHSHLTSSSRKRRGPGNPVSRELAIDIAYTLLQLDQTDMRVRLLLPALLLEGEYYQEAYDFLKNWLHADATLMIMDLALLGDGSGYSREENIDILKYSNCDIMEPPEMWMDGEMIYPSVGMVFELAFLKCHMLCSLQSSSHAPPSKSHHQHRAGNLMRNECALLDELERQVHLLLSLVHKWNPYLLPKLSEAYDIETGAPSSSRDDDAIEKGMAILATPPALSTLLNKHPPGFELQYKMGNPGGRSFDEAVAIWQRDMILWHVVNPLTMKYLSNFCLNLEDNLVDTCSLNGGIQATSNQGLNDSERTNDAMLLPSNVENAQMRKEAENLAYELQKRYPDRTMDEIMMHPDMAQLMIKHLRSETT